MRRLPLLLPLILVGGAAVTATATAEPVPEHRYVALGDSYAAMGSRHAPAPAPPDCFRSTDNYPSQVMADPRIVEGLDASCSGATTLDVLAWQVHALEADTTLVTLSIGGNDISFAQVAGCMGSSVVSQVECSPALGAEVAWHMDLLPAQLDRVHQAIRERSPEAQVIVTGYMPLLTDGECPALGALPPSERTWALQLTDDVNRIVREAAERHGAEYVLPDGVEKHTACADTGRWTDITGQFTGAYPMHPTAAGQLAMADAVLDRL